MDVHIECPCVGTPHADGDSVTMPDALPFPAAVALTNGLSTLQRSEPELDIDDIAGYLSEQYILKLITEWSLVDEAGEPLPVSRAAIRERILSNTEIAAVIAEEADGRYASALVPLLVRGSTSSRPTPITPSTSATDGSGPQPRKRPKQSSTTTSPTVATVTT